MHLHVAVSRRHVIGLGTLGLAALLFPRRDVHADSHTLREKLTLELDEFAANLIGTGVPQLARSAADEAFTTGIKDPVLSQLSGATSQERQQISLALDQVQDIVGDVTQDWTSRVIRSGNIVDTLQQSLDARLKLDQPTFQYPFNPGYNFEIGIPRPSTSQNVLEMLENLRMNKFPIDPQKLSLNWDVFNFEANSDFDRLRIRGSVSADHFFDSSFQLISPAWKAKAGLEWRFFQNGALNNLSAEVFGEFNRNSGDVWGVLLTFRVDF
jgi:hypothetical protein